MSTLRTTFEMGVREYARTPILLSLLAFLPVYLILVFHWVMPESRVTVDIPIQGAMSAEMTAVATVLTTPMAAAFVGGAAGLFLMQSASAVDGRLAIAGADAVEIVAARGGVLVLAALVGSVVSVGVLSAVMSVERLRWYLLAILLVALLYGGLGALVGLVLNRLAGVYVLLFGPFFDLFLAQSPLTDETHALAPFLPGHFPMKLAFDAALTARVVPRNLWFSLAYLAVLALVVGLGFRRGLRVD
ncbi:hypothetical protein [Halobellus clavatus]|jgi:hypothetical protein|uniref:ABC-2 type transport system permease protein n=1 Tax=Halobellus clavatus TaxID=660517 RepID=A0A1H3DP06_9EURY|nr:hypothetical protein [Halobellus clavatus]SDX68233.1 hypothetical protein SAMN04487946_101694 [Halobellus clavatus]